MKTYRIKHRGRFIPRIEGGFDYKTLTGALAGKRAFLRERRPKNGYVTVHAIVTQEPR